jgi:hypothetical protein
MGVLSEYQTPRVDVPLGQDQVVSLRGLNLDDFALLLQDHLEPISKAVQLWQQSKQDIYTSKNMQGFLMSIIKDFPGLVTEVISIAADEPDAKKVKLGLGFQTSAIAAISKLTLEEAGGLGNLFASLAALARGALQNASEMSQQATRSRGSIGE